MIDPREMVNNAGGQGVQMLNSTDIKVKMVGLPSHMLFEHMGAPASDRFMSVNAMTFTAGRGTGGIRCEDLLSKSVVGGPQSSSCNETT